jgi:hypothetical protein
VSSWYEINIISLTRQRRAEAATMRERPTLTFGEVYDDKRRWLERNCAGLIDTPFIRALAIAQDYRCYLCSNPFSPTRLATREHVTPRALGGVDDHNILLACKPCNKYKRDRPPTACELAELARINAIMLLTNTLNLINTSNTPQLRGSETPKLCS